MKSISVCHTVSSIEDLASGPAHSVSALARAQCQLGVGVELCSLGTAPTDKPTSYKDLRFPKSDFALPHLGRLGFSRPMRDFVSLSSSEIIHTHGLWMMPNIYRSEGASFVVSPRGMLSSVALAYSRRKKRLFRTLFQDRALADAALFHATAPSEYEDIRSFGLRQPVAVIANGVDIPELAEAENVVSRREVLSLGRLHKKKGLPSLVRAWAEVADEYPDWRLRIVGPDEGGHAQELEKLIEVLSLRSVTIEPPVFGDEKLKLMSEVDLFVLPTLSENFAMTVAESLSVGVPVISTKGAPWEGLETNSCGWWIDHGPEALAVTLRKALSLPAEQRRKMGARGRDWMERDFSWRNVAAEMVAAYQWLKNGGAPPKQVWTD